MEAATMTPAAKHHDPRRKAGERTLYHLTQIVSHKKDAGRTQRRPRKGNQQPLP